VLLLVVTPIFCPSALGKIIYVDDDGPADFNRVQAGMDAAAYGDTVLVAAGTYHENVRVKSGIDLVGAGADLTIIDASGYGDVVDARANHATISGFTLRNSGEFDTGHMNCGVYVDGRYAPIIKNNAIVNNRIGVGIWHGACPDIRNNILEDNSDGLYIYGSEERPSNPAIVNNTIVSNQKDGIVLRTMVSPTILNNIIVRHIGGINHNYVTGSPTLAYNNLWDNDVNYLCDNRADDALAGPGSISVDPCFVMSGYWADVNDPNIVVAGPADPNAVWVDGDYHLRSPAGRYYRNGQVWAVDDSTSPCIDAGDPASDVGDEPFPHGARINMGAYGGTCEASKSPRGTSAYAFVPERSAVVQTGGIAGVHWTYTLTGQFRLTLDYEAGQAWLSNVDAIAIDDTVPGRELDPNHVFNLSGLTGAIGPDGSIQFTGQAVDDSDVLLDVTVSDERVSLTGETIPQANSADFFIFSIEATGRRKYGGGTGEPKDPYLIYTAEHLNALGAEPNDYDKHFKLMADIDLEGHLYDGALIAPDVDPCDLSFNGASFTGVFDGNGHAISHLTIAGESYLGLFGRLEYGAQVNNLHVVDANVTGSTAYTGGLVGFSRGRIAMSYCTGMVSGDRFVGGLAGRNWGSIVTSYSIAMVMGKNDVGGLAAGNYGSIANCYSTGAVTGNWNAGGLVGANSGSITASYSTGAVGGEIRSGGLVGYNNWDYGVIASSFWDVGSSGVSASDGGTPLSTPEMQTASTFLGAGWDFVDETANGIDDIWWIDEANDYPRLWWERGGEPPL
jgi:parallel beta-helix repeat protein